MSPDVANPLWWILAVWLTVLGACVGSFLNVVIYRLPRGQSLSHPGSRCPNCGHPIRWYHNVPVVGWLLLRGRCHDCRAAIAARYPIVEATMGIVFLVLAVTGPLSGHVWPAHAAAEADRLLVRSLWAAYAWEATLLCAVFALALIDRDISASGEGRYPLGLIAATFIAAILLPLLVPGLLLHTSPGPNTAFGPPTLQTAVRHIGFGALAGCGCGCLLFAASRGERSSLRQSALPALVGPYLGPWVLLQVFAASVLVYAAVRLVLGKAKGKQSVGLKLIWRWPPLFWLASLGGIVAAHGWSESFSLPSNPSLPVRLMIGGGLLIALFTYWIAARLVGGPPD